MHLVDAQLAPEDLRHGVAGQIVRRRPEPTGRDHRARAVQRLAHDGDDCVDGIADRGAPFYRNSLLRQLPRDECAVGVDGEAEQQLVADGDELDFVLHVRGLAYFAGSSAALRSDHVIPSVIHFGAGSPLSQ